MGWAEITHPFHPFRSQRFRVLKVRRLATHDTLILQGSGSGTFAVPRDWTDRADPLLFGSSRDAAPILSVPRLIELAQLLSRLGGEEARGEGLTDA